MWQAIANSKPPPRANPLTAAITGLWYVSMILKILCPFADNSFDYIICSHVLEHVEKPELLIHELMRVGSRGYIETPSEIAERLYGWPYHNWIVNLIDGKLVIQMSPCKVSNPP